MTFIPTIEFISGSDPSGVQDSTVAFQDVIDGCPNGALFDIGGVYKIGALNWRGKPFTLRINGGIILQNDVTFDIPPYVKIVGVGGSSTAQFASAAGACFITPSATSNPAVRIYGGAQHTLENVVIGSPPGVGLKIDGAPYAGLTYTALVRLRNISCTAQTGNANSIPFQCDTAFWIDADDCTFMGLVGSHPFPVQFLQTTNYPFYNGLVRCKNLRMNNGGILISAATNQVSSDFIFEDPQIENPANGSSLLTIDGSAATSFIGRIRLLRPGIFDAAGVAYLIKNIGNKTRDLVIEDVDPNIFINNAMFDPTSTEIIGLRISYSRMFPYSVGVKTANVPSYSKKWRRSFPSSEDAIQLTAGRGPQILPRDALAIEQDPANWGAFASAGATVITGMVGPDGSTMAGQIGGTNGGVVTLAAPAITPALGDWFIFGVWSQSAEIDKQPATAQFQASFTLGGGLNGGSTSILIGTDYEPLQLADQRWVWTCEAAKITTLGTGNVTPKILLRRVSAVGITNYFMPGIIYIPASLGIPDAEIVAWSRMLQAWPSIGKTAEATMLNHQKLRLGGGQLYVEAGALKYKSPAGTITVLGVN